MRQHIYHRVADVAFCVVEPRIGFLFKNLSLIEDCQEALQRFFVVDALF